MAEKKNNCGCGCFPVTKNSEKPDKDKKKTKKSKQVERCTEPTKGMGVKSKMPVPFGLFAELPERWCKINLQILAFRHLTLFWEQQCGLAGIF